MHFYQTKLLLIAFLTILPVLNSSIAAQNNDGKTPLRNLMKGHGSPYLRLHQNDPVAWQSWGAEVTRRAKVENKMIFISIGYFSCHWCHVMQRESFSDQAVAKALNKHFIPVKVDRELNPALDAYLIEFVQRTRGTAGWPLNVIVSSEGYPIIGITYLPKDRFRKMLAQVTKLWGENQDFIKQTARQAAEQLRTEKTLKRVDLKRGMEKRYSASFAQQAIGIIDELSGGFGDQSKFPMAPQLDGLLSVYERMPNESIGEYIQLTLDQMATQGLRDHIGGGFFRYTVDPTWQTPHFEKMLYDNASLSLIYMRAAQLFNRRDYAAVARETLNFLNREFKTRDGALIASLSAVDDKDVEGGYYLWEETTLRGLLNEAEYDVVHLLWGMENKASFEAGYLPKQTNSPDAVADNLGIPVDQVMQTLAKAQQKLFKVRKSRVVPRDTKQLAAWNGLALQAFVAGARQEKGSKFKDAAKDIRDYLVNVLWDGKILRRAINNKGSLGKETLEDYVFSAQGLWQWYQLTGDKKDLQLVEQWVTIAWQRFYDNTGWRLSDGSLLPQNFGEDIIKDAPLPSPSAALVQLSIELIRQNKSSFKQSKQLDAQVQDALSIGFDKLDSNPFYYTSQIEALVSYFK